MRAFEVMIVAPWTILLTIAAVPAAPGCTSEDCVDHRCSDLSDKTTRSDTVTICDRGDGYVRLDDADGEKIYECYCDADFMKDTAARWCEEGAVCRGAGSPCGSSGDCCAGLFCSVGVCG